MNIIVSKNAGFCFGVKRAIDTVYSELENWKLYTYGPMAHNKAVISDLSARGVEIISSVDDIKEHDRKIIIRSHGVSKAVHESLNKYNVVDCTCPCVKKIHNIVSDEYNDGKKIIIVGDEKHPEVVGSNGWADNSAIIISTVNEAEALNLGNDSYALVAQTTFNHATFEQICCVLKKYNIKIYNTICNATSNNQKEAELLSKNVDKIIIIGDKLSSNTMKLVEICKKNCENVYLIETIMDLRLNNFDSDDKIGVTAGASTPPALIKEVIGIMSEQNESFEQMLNESFVSLHTGDIVKGKVIQITHEGVSVNLGYKSDGIIEKGEFSSDSTINPADVVKPGDEIEVFVVRVNDGDGNVLLSRRKVEARKGLAKIEAAFENKEVVSGKVVEIVKGGMIAVVNDIRVFVPSSQASNHFVPDLTVFKDKVLNFNILECDKSKRRYVGGRRELAQKEIEEIKERIFGSINAGDVVKGTVSRLTDFGAFVDLGGIDGLIHISEISWGPVKHPKNVLKEGQEVEAAVISIDKDKNKISLTLKNADNDPWKGVAEKYIVGSIIQGKVVRLVPFGAFVELEDGIDGLIHISQISSKHIAKAEDVLKVGQIVDVKILDVNIEQRKINLSKKEADGVAVKDEDAVEAVEENAASAEDVQAAPEAVATVEAPTEAPTEAEAN